jgi:HTH-type transcriptional regulator/antitoxin HipB
MGPSNLNTPEEYLVTGANQIGHVLRGIRRELGLSQAEVGQRVGLPQKEISKMETGSSRISLERLFLFLSALQLEIVIRHREPVPDLKDEW